MMRLIMQLAAVALLGTSAAVAADVAKVPDEFSVAAVGDIIYLRPALRTLEQQSGPLLRVLRSADVSFGNFESNSFPIAGFTGTLQSQLEGPALLTPPDTLRELQAMGFDLVSHANNHSFDFGPEGIRATNRYLDRSKLAHAGSGIDLRAARAPGYFSSRGARVALVAATSSYFEPAVAADAWGVVKARAGVSTLGVRSSLLVAPQDFAALKSLAPRLPNAGLAAQGASQDEIRLLGQTVRPDSSIRDRAEYAYFMEEADRRGILAAVAEARKHSGIVLFSLHTHQPVKEPTASPNFVSQLAHDAIDAGADMFIAHGPHQLRGIEIYRGKPIFYSLANFAIMQPSVDLNPKPLVIPPGSLFTQRAFFESVIAVGRYRKGELAEIELHPFELSDTGISATHGLPQPLAEQPARAIIERLQKLSAQFGTRISFENGAGIIRLSN